jgi:hypothetical protein
MRNMTFEPARPGSAVAVHRHTGDVHAFNLAGTREIFGTGERVGPCVVYLAWCREHGVPPDAQMLG